MVLKTCPICGRQFSKSEHFKRHQHAHTGERPFQCFVCKKRYTRRDVLDRHTRGHSPSTVEAAISTAAASAGAGQDDQNITASVPDTRNRETEGQVEALHSGTVSQQSTAGAAQAIRIITQESEAHIDIMNAISETMQGDLYPNNIEEHMQNWTLDLSSTGSGLLQSYDYTSQVAHDFSGYGPDFSFDSEIPGGARIEDLEGFLARDTIDNPQAELFQPQKRSNRFSNTPISLGGRENSHRADNVLTVDPLEGSQDSIKGIPITRFHASEKYWLLNPPRNLSHSMEVLWPDIVSMSVKNLFCELSNPASTQQDLPVSSGWGLDEACKRRLQDIFHSNGERYQHSSSQDTQQDMRASESRSYDSHSPSGSGASLGKSNSVKFPTTNTIEMALAAFIRNFQPMMPFVHNPTFNVASAPPSFLYPMCLIGLVVIGTPGAIAFVSQQFPSVLDKISKELNDITLVTESTHQLLIILGSSLLLINLAAMTGKEQHIQQSQSLYVTLLSAAQRHGLFAVNEGSPLGMTLLDPVSDIEQKWQAWARIESAKRLIIGLLIIDSWFATSFHTSPIVRPDAVQVLLPCDEELFQAESAKKWMQLVQADKQLFMPPVVSSLDGTSLPEAFAPQNSFSMIGVLSIVQLRLCDTSQRLVYTGGEMISKIEPWQLMAQSNSGKSIVPLVVEIGDKYGNSFKNLNPSCLMMWHHACMMLTLNERVLKLAAGCAGASQAKEALEAMEVWSQTKAARRACVHAGQILKLMLNRRASEGSMMHSVPALFTSALVLIIYLYSIPPTVPPNGLSLELLGEVDWASVGAAGMTKEFDSRVPDSDSTSGISRAFIEEGGLIYLSGRACEGGAESGRRLLQEYAILLDSMKMWTLSKLSRVLRAMGDVLVEK